MNNAKRLDEIADKLDTDWTHDGRAFRADLAKDLRRIARHIRMGITEKDLDDPTHPVGVNRWTFIPNHRDITDSKWEMCEVVRAYSSEGSKYGPYPELYDVRRKDGSISRAHFATSLRQPTWNPPKEHRG